MTSTNPFSAAARTLGSACAAMGVPAVYRTREENLGAPGRNVSVLLSHRGVTLRQAGGGGGGGFGGGARSPGGPTGTPSTYVLHVAANDTDGVPALAAGDSFTVAGVDAGLPERTTVTLVVGARFHRDGAANEVGGLWVAEVAA